MNFSSRKKCTLLALVSWALLFATPVTARPSIGLVLKFRGGDFWGAIEQGAKEAAEAADVDLIVKGTKDSSNFTAQLKLVEGLVNQKVDALVIMPSNPEHMLLPIKAWADQGVRIVVGETQLTGNITLPFVGLDQTKLSIDAATAFAGVVQDGGEVSIFRGTTADYTLRQREITMLATLKELRPQLKLRLNFYSVETDSGTALTKAELLLQKYPDSNLFIATASSSTNNLLGAVKRLGLSSKVKVAGFGSLFTPVVVEDIESGLIPVYILQHAKDIGAKSVVAAVALAKGEKVPLVTSTDYFVVTKENIKDPRLKPLFIEAK